MATTTTTSRLSQLKPGDKIRVTSLSGTIHEITVVYSHVDRASLFVRLPTGKLARLTRDRVDWRTLEKFGATDFAGPGDEVIVVDLGGTERRGRLTAPITDRVEMSTTNGGRYSVPLEETAPREFRLLFPTTRVRAGDEFLVKSRSGSEYRGLVRDVGSTALSVLLRPEKKSVRLKTDLLDLDSLYVLIPAFGASDPPSWTGGNSGGAA